MFMDFVFVLYVELCIFGFFHPLKPAIHHQHRFISVVSNGLKVLPVRLLMMSKVLRVPLCPLYFYFLFQKWLGC